MPTQGMGIGWGEGRLAVAAVDAAERGAALYSYRRAGFLHRDWYASTTFGVAGGQGVEDRAQGEGGGHDMYPRLLLYPGQERWSSAPAAPAGTTMTQHRAPRPSR